MSLRLKLPAPVPTIEPSEKESEKDTFGKYFNFVTILFNGYLSTNVGYLQINMK